MPLLTTTVASSTADAAGGARGVGGFRSWSAGLTLAALCAVGLLMRWYDLPLAEFNGDQAWVVNRAYDLVTRGDLPLVGIGSSVGPPQGPLELYLLALPLLLSADPLVATAFVGLLQVLAVVGTYFLAARYFGRPVGLTAAALFVANPFAIHHARKIWTPDLLPLFTVLFCFALFAAVIERRRWLLAVAWALAAALCMIHVSGVLMLPVLLVATALSWRRSGWRPPAVGALLAFLVTLPYLYADLRQGFDGLRRLAIASAGGQTVVDLRSLELVVGLATTRFVADLRRAAADTPLATLLDVVDVLAISLLAVGLALSAWRAGAGIWRRRGAATEGWEAYLLLLLWFALPIVVSLRHPAAWQAHYFLVVYPVQFILIGVGLAGLVRLASHRPRTAAAGLAAAIILLAAPQIAAYGAYLERAEPPSEVPVMGIPLAYSQQAMASLRELRAQSPARLYIYCSFNQWFGISYLARPDLPVEKVEPPFAVVLPHDLSTGVLMVLAANDAAYPMPFTVNADDSPLVRTALALGFADLPERAIRGRSGRLYYRFLYLPPERAAALAGYRQPVVQLQLPNGLRLAGYTHPAAATKEGEIDLALLWDMPQDPTQYPWGEANLFVHVVDRQGRTLAQQDWELFQYRRLWRSGEYMLTDHRLTLPADLGPRLVWLDVGVYERYGRQPIPWLDAAGKPLGPALRLGPLKVAPPAVEAAPAAPATYSFGDWLALSGYELAPSPARPGQTLVVRLDWRAAATPPGDYTVSVQVLSTEGRLVGQHDAPPVGGNYPTAYWAPGEAVTDVHEVPLPADLPAGEYSATVVVYSTQGGERLPVRNSDGTRAGDRALLAKLRLGG